MLRLCFIVMFCPFFLTAFAVDSPSLIVMTEDYRPFQFKRADGKISGFSVELLREVFKDAGVKIHKNKIILQAWPRSYSILQKKSNAALFMTTRNEKREKLFRWVGPIASRAKWYYVLKSRKDVKISSKEDLKKYLIGSVRGSASTNNIISQGLRVDLALDNDKNMQKFLKGRVDVISSLEISMNDRLKQYGLSYDAVDKVLLLNNDYSYYLALNLAAPDELVKALQAALDKMKKDGRYDKLYKTYLE